MQFSDTTNLNGLIQDIDFRCSTDDNQYPLEDKTRNINIAYDKVVDFIISKTKRIKWADTTNTAPYNLADYNLTSGTKTVEITTPYNFRGAEIKDSAGNWTELKLISEDDITGAVQEFMDVEGIPRYISITGDSATLYPTPNYTQTNSLRIYDVKETTLFDSTDTTDEPVIPRLAHSLLSIDASIGYCSIYKAERVNALLLDKKETESRLESHINRLDRSKTVIQGNTTNAE